MLARELAEPYPVVTLDSDALDAARLVVERQLPGLLVVDDDGLPKAVLPTSQLVALVVPPYVVDDPRLASVVDERHADKLFEVLAGRTVRSCLPRDRKAPTLAMADDTALEVAALMARQQGAIVAVVDKTPGGTRLLGVISAARLLGRLLPRT